MPLPANGQQDFAVEFYKYMDSEFPASPELHCPQFMGINSTLTWGMF